MQSITKQHKKASTAITILSIGILLLSAATAFAQAPNKMSYQAVIRNASNALVTNAAVGMRISILQTSVSGTSVYTETQTPTTNANGLISIEIGGGTVVSGAFATIDWSAGPYFVKTETDPSGGSNYSISATSQLLSVPYALYAQSAGSVSSAGSFTHYIGERFGGGVIFHLWKDSLGVEHGLVVALTNQTSSNWSNITGIIAGANNIWNGLTNSNIIIVQSGHTDSAAAVCLSYQAGGFNDWYLPSIQEFNMLYNNYFTVAKSLALTPGAIQLSPVSYWSSTETGTSGAARFNVAGGIAENGMPKTGSAPVRAIRAF